MQMADLMEAANSAGIQVMQTAKKPAEAVEHETPGFLTQSLGRNNIKHA